MTHSLRLAEPTIIDNYEGQSKGQLADYSNEVYFSENF